MSDDSKSGKPAQPEDAARTPTIDLDKSAVTEVTPPVEADAAAAPTQEPQQEPQREPPAEAAAAPVPPPPVAERPASKMPVAAGALAGALFGVLGAYGLQTYVRPPVAAPDPRVQDMQAAVAAVEKKTVDAGQIEQRLREQIAKIDLRAAAIESKAAEVAQKAAALDQRAQALEQKSNEIEQKAAAVEQKATLADQRASGFEQRAATLVQPVDDRLKAAETRLGEARELATALGKRIDLLAQIEPPKVDLRPVIAKVDEIERAVGANAARVTMSGEAATALDQRVKGVEQSLKDMAQGLKGFEQGREQTSGVLKGLEGAVQGIGAQAKALEGGLAELKARKTTDPASALLAISGLTRRALEAGEPLGAFTGAMAALGVPDAAVKPLAAFAQSPAPRLVQLADLVGDLAAKAPKSPAPAPAPARNERLIDRVASGLLSQVDVRKVGSAAPVDPTGIAAQARQKVLAGDLAGAVELVKALGPEQQAVLQPFVDAAQARLAAQAALRQIEGDALAAAARKG